MRYRRNCFTFTKFDRSIKRRKKHEKERRKRPWNDVMMTFASALASEEEVVDVK